MSKDTTFNKNTKMNTTLKNQAQIQETIEASKQAGYVHRADRPKNWDNFKALRHVIERFTDKNSSILDAGGIEASAFLPSLAKLGYSRLVALDLSNPTVPKISNGIVYKRGDITATQYPPHSFHAVACLSVVEHGVDLRLFFSEMQRIIKPGGSLIVSTDYWPEKIINADGRRAYGVPVHIFSKEEILQLISIANEFGFRITSEPDLEAEDKTVSWMGFSYTFVILCFEAAS
jgi:2-polyprenyl-3-methyl-5-hydroxy-6-metoxy-1,4-benzoquinol methylase